MRTRWRRSFVAMLAGCGLAAGPAFAQPGAPSAFSCTPSSGTLGGLQVLQHVTATAESANDRIVLEFATLPAPSGVGATFTVSAATPPFSAGASGKPLTVGGQAFVKLALHNAYLQDPVTAPPTASYTGPTDLKPGLSILTEASLSDSFEGNLSWILGLRRIACWQVTRLTAPVRLVVDLQAEALPVTGPPAPLVPLGLAGLAALAAGVAVLRRGGNVEFEQLLARGGCNLPRRVWGFLHPTPHKS
jgi:hypothetical protein